MFDRGWDEEQLSPRELAVFFAAMELDPPDDDPSQYAMAMWGPREGWIDA